MVVACVARNVAFGLLQEQSKAKVNHYLNVGDEAGFWEDESMNGRRGGMQMHLSVGTRCMSVVRLGPFHGLSRGELVAFKWILSESFCSFSLRWTCCF